MSDKLDIEKLFQEKFDNFEAEVSPDVWSNLSQTIGTKAAVTTAAKTGISSLMKTALIAGGVVVAGVTGVYLFNMNGDDSSNKEIAADQQLVPVAEDETPSLIYVDEIGDSAIESNKKFIENELVNSQEEVQVYSDDVMERVMVEIDEKTEEQVDLSALIKEIEALLNNNNSNSESASTNDGTTIKENTAAENSGTSTNSSNEDDKGVVTEDVEQQKSKAVISAPYNVFTPNGDNRNDNWFIKTEDVASFQIQIYNKLGERVFVSNDPDFRWNGTDMKGERVESGTYTYIIVAQGTDGLPLGKKDVVYVQ